MMLRSIDVHKIKSNPYQPRTKFIEESLLELKESIKKHGVIQPVLVKTEQDCFTLIAGERRLRATKDLGLTEIPALIAEVREEELASLALVENLQREDLNPIEIAVAYQVLIDQRKLTHEQLGKLVGKERTSITNHLRLLTLDQEIKVLIAEAKLSTGHAKELLRLQEKKDSLRMANIIVAKNLSVVQTRRLVTRELKEKASGCSEGFREAEIEYLADQLRSHLKTKVRLLGSAQSGRIEISYFSSVELERLINTLGLESEA